MIVPIPARMNASEPYSLFSSEKIRMQMKIREGSKWIRSSRKCFESNAKSVMKIM